jgi:hypothetical protein
MAVLPAGPRDMETLLKLDAWENQGFRSRRLRSTAAFPR